ncbi:MAG: hypothetical protein SV765_07315 [Pseudomonadota bacterium]|nr:hypothetical protein [Pseudomonadales bacterium]MDY6920005.1 hypothetical protein [Pseudomonadota bacterium]
MRPLLALILFTALPVLATAQDLTDAEIRQWTQAYQAVVNWAEKTDLEEEMAPSQEPTEYQRIFSQMLEQSQTHSRYRDLAGVLKQQGYKNPQQWAATGDRIMTAFLATQMDGDRAEVERQLKQMQTMLDSGMIPEGQKAMMEKMLQESKRALAAAQEAPAADRAAIKRNQQMLDAVFNRE